MINICKILKNNIRASNIILYIEYTIQYQIKGVNIAEELGKRKEESWQLVWQMLSNP